MTAENLTWFFILAQLAILLAGVRLKRAYPDLVAAGRDPAGYLAAGYFYSFGHCRDRGIGARDRVWFFSVSVMGWLSLAALVRIGWIQLAH